MGYHSNYTVRIRERGLSLKEWAASHSFAYDTVRKVVQGIDLKKYHTTVTSPMGLRIKKALDMSLA